MDGKTLGQVVLVPQVRQASNERGVMIVPLKLDLRGGCLAIYPASEEHNCLSGAENWALHYKHGVSTKQGWVMDEKDVAYARVFAASPKLLATAKECVKELEGAYEGGSYAINRETIDALYAAITEAEGHSKPESEPLLLATLKHEFKGVWSFITDDQQFVEIKRLLNCAVWELTIDGQLTRTFNYLHEAREWITVNCTDLRSNT